MSMAADDAHQMTSCCEQRHGIDSDEVYCASQISYLEAARQVLDEGGVRALLGRGLQTRLITNGLQVGGDEEEEEEEDAGCCCCR
jgi:hypothetical protein